MSRTLYAYAGSSGAAVKHLIGATALAGATEVTETTWAGAPALRVELTTPMPSTGERLLWKVAGSINDGGTVDLHDCSLWLDADTLAAIHAALAMAWGVDSEVTS